MDNCRRCTDSSDSFFRYRIMKKEIRIIAVAFAIYIFNRLCKGYINIPLIGYLCKCHLNDYIGGIIFPAYVNILLIQTNRKPVKSYSAIGTMMLCCGIVWEYIFPYLFAYSTSDILDVVSYILGGITYCFLIRNYGKTY